MFSNDDPGVCGLCVWSVSFSASTYVRIEVNEPFSMSDNGFGAHAPELTPGPWIDISNYLAAQPENMVRLARKLPRAALVSLTLDHQLVGLWPDLIFGGTPICIRHIHLADDLWGRAISSPRPTGRR